VLESAHIPRVIQQLIQSEFDAEFAGDSTFLKLRIWSPLQLNVYDQIMRSRERVQRICMPKMHGKTTMVTALILTGLLCGMTIRFHGTSRYTAIMMNACVKNHIFADIIFSNNELLELNSGASVLFVPFGWHATSWKSAVDLDIMDDVYDKSNMSTYSDCKLFNRVIYFVKSI